MHARRACIDPHKERKRRSKVRWIDYDLHWDVSCPGGGHLKSLISDQSRNFSWREREKKRKGIVNWTRTMARIRRRWKESEA